MNKKVVFLDIDGTFRDPVYGIPDSAVEAVENARKNGHIVIICTGRTMGLIPDDIDKNAFDGFIAGGGCHIEYCGKTIFDSEISSDRILKICNGLDRLGISYRIETKKSVYMTPEMADKLGFLGCTADMNSELRQMTAVNNKFQFRYTIDDYRKNPVSASKICTLSRDANFNDILLIAEGYYTIKHSDAKNSIVNTEIIQQGCDNGSAIKRMADYLKIDQSVCIAFGDSMNDVDMFAASGFSAAMSNGEKRLIEKADMVCPHIMEDGLYKGFKKIGLI